MTPHEFAGQVEALLEEQNALLTMGGEPTFVSRTPEGGEWNNEAMGPEKLGVARRMAAELIREEMPGALAMQVFGKWYPGEPLPRWNILLLHAEGDVLWAESDRLLLDDVEGKNQPETARVLSHRIAEGLGLKRDILPAVEQDGEKELAGWVLPLTGSEGEWTSASWPFSAERPVPLLMGDSPVGLRLPLHELEEEVPRGALTVEVRRGGLEVFIPPLEWPEFRELIMMIREIVRELDLRDVVFCGYGPAKCGEEVVKLGLAADPGVLEVNLPPAMNWTGYEAWMRRCDKAADAVGLIRTKTQLNGVVRGTGGGAHLAFGGPDLERNPFLQEPSRVTSILRYWQHHPALSYLFSGQYVGPGSQAPRVDEGPTHGLYELEVACEGIEQSSPPPDGERMDQFLRNLLTDSAGNTHRAELCFDKFHNASMPNGTLGIVEFRAFETYGTLESMTAVALFVRAVLARLFADPFREPLKRFGPELNDRYFLPAFLWEDVLEICEDLREHGLDFDPEWLAPVIDFRCPEVGCLDLPGGGAITVRTAFESWPLMAEESLEQSTVRVVDNSTDRLQVTLSDPACLQRGFLLANGIRVPFQEVGGTWICGIRYKCASAYPALHPHVPIQSPLHLEWVDAATGRTSEAARYYYWNPEGPVYEGRPGTEEEARLRREVRWQEAGDLVGRQAEVIEPKRAPEYRFTLDLRRQLRA